MVEESLGNRRESTSGVLEWVLHRAGECGPFTPCLGHLLFIIDNNMEQNLNPPWKNPTWQGGKVTT